MYNTYLLIYTQMYRLCQFAANVHLSFFFFSSSISLRQRFTNSTKLPDVIKLLHCQRYHQKICHISYSLFHDFPWLYKTQVWLQDFQGMKNVTFKFQNFPLCTGHASQTSVVLHVRAQGLEEGDEHQSMHF